MYSSSTFYQRECNLWENKIYNICPVDKLPLDCKNSLALPTDFYYQPNLGSQGIQIGFFFCLPVLLKHNFMQTATSEDAFSSFIFFPLESLGIFPMFIGKH